VIGEDFSEGMLVAEAQDAGVFGEFDDEFFLGVGVDGPWNVYLGIDIPVDVQIVAALGQRTVGDLE